jgi:hypothetical protein
MPREEIDSSAAEVVCIPFGCLEVARQLRPDLEELAREIASLPSEMPSEEEDAKR